MTPRPLGLADWAPRRASLQLLDQVQQVLVEYATHLPLTLRQIFYRLVGAFSYQKTEQAYERLGELLNRARRAGRIDWEAIRDDGWTIHTPHHRGGPEELVRVFQSEMETLRLDRQQNQRVRLWFAVEAAGMLPQIERIAEPFGITCCSSGGFDSVTAKYGLAEFLADEGSCEVLHIGDHDPSGVHLFKNLEADISAFANDAGLDADITFTRLAVTPEQIKALHLPTAPPKPTDRRTFSGETVQAEAIPPNVLAKIVRQAIEDRLDHEAYQAVLARERAIHAWAEDTLAPLLSAIPDFTDE